MKNADKTGVTNYVVCGKIHTAGEHKEEVIGKVGKPVNVYYNISNSFTKKKQKISRSTICYSCGKTSHKYCYYGK